MQSIVNVLEAGKSTELVQSSNMEIDGDDVTATIDVEDQTGRTQGLESVLAGLNHSWQQRSNGINTAAEKLADGCRDRRLSILFFPPNFLINLSTFLSSHSRDCC